MALTSIHDESDLKDYAMNKINISNDDYPGFKDGMYSIFKNTFS